MIQCHDARLRCPICGNPDWHSRDEGEECTHCGLCVEDAEGLDQARFAIPARLSDGIASGQSGDRWSLLAPAWRNAAWRYGYLLDGSAAVRARPVEHAITLAVMTSSAQATMAADLVAELAFPKVIVAIDAADRALWKIFEGATILAQPLDGDFATQRNRLQMAAQTGWVLHLDSDERPDSALLASLGWLVAAADRDGLQSLGIPRVNLVDGSPTALYPDIQYRLNRNHIRFTGTVHERPVVPFKATSLALTGNINHHLTAERVRARTHIYSELSSDGARHEDEARLLRPFDAIADR